LEIALWDPRAEWSYLHRDAAKLCCRRQREAAIQCAMPARFSAWRRDSAA
jgi:hypothetical protein